MIYAQIRSGQKMHLAYEPGEGRSLAALIPAGQISTPLCGQRVPASGYRMTCNLPLAHVCKACARVWRARYGA